MFTTTAAPLSFKDRLALENSATSGTPATASAMAMVPRKVHSNTSYTSGLISTCKIEDDIESATALEHEVESIDLDYEIAKFELNNRTQERIAFLSSQKEDKLAKLKSLQERARSLGITTATPASAVMPAVEAAPVPMKSAPAVSWGDSVAVVPHTTSSTPRASVPSGGAGTEEFSPAPAASRRGGKSSSRIFDGVDIDAVYSWAVANLSEIANTVVTDKLNGLLSSKAAKKPENEPRTYFVGPRLTIEKVPTNDLHNASGGMSKVLAKALPQSAEKRATNQRVAAYVFTGLRTLSSVYDPRRESKEIPDLGLEPLADRLGDAVQTNLLGKGYNSTLTYSKPTPFELNISVTLEKTTSVPEAPVATRDTKSSASALVTPAAVTGGAKTPPYAAAAKKAVRGGASSASAPVTPAAVTGGSGAPKSVSGKPEQKNDLVETIASLASKMTKSEMANMMELMSSIASAKTTTV